jgi:predicted RND superfamily exporter protein
MTAYLRFVIRHRWPVLLALLLVTGAAGYSASRGIVASSMGRMLLGEHPGYQRYLERSKDFGNNDFIIVSVAEPEALSPAAQERLSGACRAVAALQGVSDVRSVLDVQDIRGTADGISVQTFAAEAARRPGEAGRILERLKDDPLAGGLFVSRDGRHTAVAVELEASAELAAEKAPALLSAIEKAFRTAGYDPDALGFVGTPTNIAAIVSETNFNIGRLFPLVCAIMLLTVWMMFRRLWPVGVSMAVALIAVIWTMGVSVLLDRYLTIMASIIPSVILIISFSDVIHLCNAYLLELDRGLSKEEAILAAGSEVGAACLLTSVTTFAGFISLSMVPAPIFRHTGMVLAFGVSAALLIAVTLVPIVFYLLPRPGRWRVEGANRVQALLDAFLRTMDRITRRHPGLIALGFAAAATLSAYGVTRLNVETDLAGRLSEDHPHRVDRDFFRDRFAGANMVDIFIKAPREGGLLQGELFNRVARYQNALQAERGVERTYSLVDLVEKIHREFTRGDRNAERLPSTPGALAQYLLLFEMSGGSDLDRSIDFDRSTMRMTLTLPGEGVLHTRAVGERAAALAKTYLRDAASVEISGLSYLMGEWLEEIVAGQRRGLGLAIAAITVMMVLGLGSVRAGLWSMVPNMLPLLVLGGTVGLLWDRVDSDVIAVAMIAIGIGVDDTVHFLMRLRLESRRRPDLSGAISRTFEYSGRGIVITTVILALGFAPFAASDYLSIYMMGTLLPLTLLVAFLADVALVPALVRLGAIRFK